jgi:cytochrome c oxidase subunit 2
MTGAALQSVLAPAGFDAAIIAQFAWVMFGAGGVILAAVMALLALAVRRGPRPVKPMRWLAGAGIAFPVLVLSALQGWSTWRSAQLTPQSSQQALVVSVTAKMWWWEVRYDDPAGGPPIVSANEIHIPAGRRVYLSLATTDVIHSLWIPALSGKKDMLPGRVSALTLVADQPGVYRGQCAEYCGAQHARMALHVVAHTPGEYEAWLARQRQPAAAPTDAFLERGRQAFVAQRCGACHTIRGVADAARPGLGPDLTHVGSRAHIAAGTLRTHQGTLAGWIADPQAIKPGAFMPAAGDIDGETLRALAAYLEQLK